MIHLRKKNNHSLTGFSVIELMVVIVVIGILSAVSTLSYNSIQVRARDVSVLSDLDVMDTIQTNYGVKNNVSGKEYYSGSGSDLALDFNPSSGNVIDVVINTTDYCIRGYNSKGTKNSINNAFIKESSVGVCSQLAASQAATGGTIIVTGGTVTYTDSNGLNPRSSSQYTGGYTVRTFVSTSSLNVTGGTISNANVLVVAGGGSGGNTFFESGGLGCGGLGGQVLEGLQNLSGLMAVTIGGGAVNSVFGMQTAVHGNTGLSGVRFSSSCPGVHELGGNGGSTSSISGNSVLYARDGYNGDDRFDNDGNPGTANTGNGGDGASDCNQDGRSGGTGGSGIIIVRYPNL